MEASKAVAAKLLEVMKDVSAVPKKKKGGVNYEFQAWEDVLPAVRQSCIKHGLVIVPSMGASDIGTWTAKSGGESAVHNVPLRFKIIDADTGESIEAEWSGEARDVSDKGKQKAATSGMKYWLLKLFMVPDEASVATDEEAHSVAQAVRQQAKAANKKEPNPAGDWLKANKVDPEGMLMNILKVVGTRTGKGWKQVVVDYLGECKDAGDEATPHGLQAYAEGIPNGG